MDFPLISFDPDTGIATVGMPKVPRAVRGINKLVQIVVVGVLKNGLQDVFGPDQGTGIRAMIGQFNYYDPAEIRVEIIQRIKRLEQQIIINQTGFNVPASEKLAKLKVLSVISDPITGATAASIQVFNEAGQSKTTVV